MRLELVEHDMIGATLTSGEAAALTATGAVTVLPAGNDRWVVRATRQVGVIRAGERELWIRPRVGTERLLHLLGHARDPEGWRDDDLDLAPTAQKMPEITDTLSLSHRG